MASGRPLVVALLAGGAAAAAAWAGPAAGLVIAAAGALAAAMATRRAAPAVPAPGPAFRGLLDALPQAVAVVDAEGRLERANAAFARAIGAPGPEVLAGRALEALTGGRRPAWFDDALAGTGVLHREVALLGPTGARASFDAAVAALRDGDTAHGVLLLLRDAEDVDLTRELSPTPSHIRDPAWFFQSLFDAVEDPITVLGLDGEILQANRSARALFGKDLVGRKCYRAFRMRDTACEECPALETQRTLESKSVEHRLFGNAITRITTYPLLGQDGAVQAVINYKRDVTQERLLEELKAGFIAVVSHELRTPLTSIVGFNKLNLRRLSKQVAPALADGPERAREALATVLEDMRVMQSEAERLGRLVNDVLDLSKLEAGKLALHLDEVPVGPLVEGAVAGTAALWRTKGLRVEAAVPPDCPPAWGDQDRVAQVLVNLLSNAIKFTVEGEIVVAVTATPRELRFAVRDSGPGIPPDQIAHVFEKFRQVGDTMPGRAPGTGLGLAISRELVGLHGGRIWAESEPGQGSTFTFTVPRADSLTAAERLARRSVFAAG
jgi:signal transduction histidine kinase